MNGRQKGDEYTWRATKSLSHTRVKRTATRTRLADAPLDSRVMRGRFSPFLGESKATREERRRTPTTAEA